VFTESAHGWHQIAELEGSDTVGGDAFGLPVAASLGTIVVGADGHAEHAGRVYVFQR
jgi:FG-GAP repeat